MKTMALKLLFRAFLIAVVATVYDAVPARAQQGYTLGPGDIIRVRVFGEPDLSGEFEVGPSGRVSLPLTGETMLGGMTLGAAERRIEAALKGDFLQKPDVSVEVLRYRPFFIAGEVNNQGQFPYVPGLTVHKAVVIAGGFTPRADEDDVLLKVGGVGEPAEVDLDTVVNPGDIIIVEQRWF